MKNILGIKAVLLLFPFSHQMLLFNLISITKTLQKLPSGQSRVTTLLTNPIMSLLSLISSLFDIIDHSFPSGVRGRFPGTDTSSDLSLYSWHWRKHLTHRKCLIKVCWMSKHPLPPGSNHCAPSSLHVEQRLPRDDFWQHYLRCLPLTHQNSALISYPIEYFHLRLSDSADSGVIFLLHLRLCTHHHSTAPPRFKILTSPLLYSSSSFPRTRQWSTSANFWIHVKCLIFIHHFFFV